MVEILRPATPDQVREAVAWAAGHGHALEVVGGGGKRAIGRPVTAPARLELDRLTGIVLYEPEELVMTAQAGTPLAEIRAALAERRQHLAFEPADLGPLLGQPAGGGTIGGAFAANLAGSRRPMAGAARDHILGVSCVGGTGLAFKAGGRVVKNVTGFDLPKLLAGSWGTLAVMTGITFKVLPRPEDECTVLVAGLDDAAAVALLGRALGSSHEPTGAAHLPAALAAISAVAAVRAIGAAVTALRVDGPGPSVTHRAEALAGLAGGQVVRLGHDDSMALWTELREVRPLADGDDAVWRLAVPPAAGARVRAAIAGGRAYYDRGGGQIWLALPAEGDCGLARVRAAVGQVGGTATLMRAPEAARAELALFQPPGPALAGLWRRVKQSFDPLGILNPGRMVEGL